MYGGYNPRAQHGYGPPPLRPGLGAPGAPSNGHIDLSRPPPGYNGPPPGFGNPNNANYSPLGQPVPQAAGPAPAGSSSQVALTLFIGSIAAGIKDEVLEQLLNACGPLKTLKRVSGATGKPQAFGFAEYEDPDSVLRALAVLNGAELPDLETFGRGKALVVKADEKTRKFLDDYETQLMRTDADDQTEAIALKSITAILTSLAKGDALPSTDSTAMGGSDGANKSNPNDPYEVPAHLRDLDAEDVPEETRGQVLDQISAFRHTSVAKEQNKKRAEEEFERKRIERMLLEQSKQRQQGGSTGGASTSLHGASFGSGPQGYNKPVGFIGSTGASTDKWGNASSSREVDDEKEEEKRKALENRRKIDRMRERERQFESKERGRMNNLDKEANNVRSKNEAEERQKIIAQQRFANWDDDLVAEGGKELFYSDRARWRSQRSQIVRRELQADEADIRAEAAQAAQLQKESEEFIARQMEEMAALASKQKAQGLLTDDAAPIKLSVGGLKVEKSAQHTTVIRPTVVGLGVAEDDEEAEKKGRRTLIKLDEEIGDGLTPEQREKKRIDKLTKIADQIPRKKEDLIPIQFDWSAFAEPAVKDKLISFVKTQMIKVVGDDEDLIQFVLDHLNERKGFEELVEGLEANGRLKNKL